MRRRMLIAVAGLLLLPAFLLVPGLGISKLGLTQGGPTFHEEFIYATYEFNTLRNPTGLLGLSYNVATGCSNYTTA